MSFLRGQQHVIVKTNDGIKSPTTNNNIFLSALNQQPPNERTFALPRFGVAAPSASTKIAASVVVSTQSSFDDGDVDADAEAFGFDLDEHDAMLPETVVYVDGSFFDETQQAGCGIYFPDEQGQGQGQSFSMPFCQAPLSALRAELCAATTAARIFLHDGGGGERGTSQRRLIIKQDCSKATNMILACKKEIKQAQFAQRQQHQNLMHQARRLRELEAELKAELKKEEEEDKKEVVVATATTPTKTAKLRDEIAALTKNSGPVDEPIPTGIAPSPLAELLRDRSPDTIIFTHDKYTVSIGDLLESLDLLEPFLTLMRIFPIRLSHVMAHQERPPDHEVQALRDWRGNNFADVLAKQGSRGGEARPLPSTLAPPS